MLGNVTLVVVFPAGSERSLRYKTQEPQHHNKVKRRGIIRANGTIFSREASTAPDE